MADSRPRLIAITDVARFGEASTLVAFERLCFAARPRSVCVQLRLDGTARTQLELGRRLRRICVESEQILGVNDRFDVALALEVNAVHLKSKSVSAAEVRRLWTTRGWPLWISQAWHPADEAAPDAVDALVVSPVMGARKGRNPLGPAGLAQCVGAVAPLEVYALGGIEAANVRGSLAAGARGVAAIGACYLQPLPLVQELGIIR